MDPVSTAEYDRSYSDTPDDGRRGQPNVMGSSEYSPVSDAEQEPREVAGSSEYSPVSGVEQEPRKVKTESLRMAQAVQVLTQHQQAT